MSVAVLRGDARHLPLPDASVDLIVTSPPYFGLRSYTDGCPTCAEEARKANCGYRARYCRRCDLTTARLRCNGCQGATVELEKKPAARADCPDCGGRGQRHYDGQIGSEATPAEWLAAMVECTAEMVRVLRPEGSIFINIGDKYSSGAGAQTGEKSAALRSDKHGHGGGSKWATVPPRRPVEGVPTKSLLGLPWRYALACTDQLGLILRAEIIWAKPNGLPESVTDRVRRSHEQIFHLTKSPRYYTAIDEIREPQVEPDRHGWNGAPRVRNGRADGRNRGWQAGDLAFNPLGKLPGSVWAIPSQPLSVPPALGVDHFAAFPVELPRRIVLGWSPPGICVACGQGRRPVALKQHRVTQFQVQDKHRPGLNNRDRSVNQSRLAADVTITGYVCACGEESCSARSVSFASTGGVTSTAAPANATGRLPPTRPAVVLDPFAGTGTTLLAADAYGRHAIGLDRSMDYARLARWRTSDPGERAKAMQVPKPPPVMDGQDALFTL